MFGTAPKAIYRKAYEILSTDATLSYMKLRESGYRPRENITPDLFPWAFVDLGDWSGVDPYRFGMVFDYELTIPVIALTYADKGRPEEMLFQADENPVNENKGIGDIMVDLGLVFWGYKVNRFGLAVGIIDWTITRIGVPTNLGLQALLLNPHVLGKQMDLTFHIKETLTMS